MLLGMLLKAFAFAAGIWLHWARRGEFHGPGLQVCLGREAARRSKDEILRSGIFRMAICTQRRARDHHSSARRHAVQAYLCLHFLQVKERRVVSSCTAEARSTVPAMHLSSLT